MFLGISRGTFGALMHCCVTIVSFDTVIPGLFRSLTSSPVQFWAVYSAILRPFVSHQVRSCIELQVEGDCRSIFCSFGLRDQQSTQRCLDFCLFVQLLWGVPRPAKSHGLSIMFWRHPGRTPEPPQLAPVDMEEERVLHTESRDCQRSCLFSIF